ncbi:lysozyme inhibitor LprI family protein [Pseudomonas sp. Irchel s3f10]|uniref:lysozyme inhibitor LprI family protein n=1 Tax=Pseudomonas sp. Irchel s3f10 TaxID=2009137 RepID=UPI000BA32339|nr:lysozyme inhibitor LprI family protein [Pseudomonas sp. Irchel s3f10]
MYIKGRCIVSACALLFFQQAMAAGMDCAKAVTAVEKTICANTGLYELDTQMGEVYRDLFKASVETRPQLKGTQRLWLKTRNECAEDVSCLDQRYREQLKSLQAQWAEAVAHQPTGADKEVLDDLQKRIQTASQNDPEFALERTLASLTLNSAETSFSAEPDADQFANKTHFPKTLPKGVSRSEWTALNATDFEADTAQGPTSFTLLDLDNDGRRDLIVQTYTGGTGLYTFVEIFHRDGDRFTRRTQASDGESIGGSLYSINERGSNQSVNWISIHGKVYAAYRDSGYGIDNVYLLSPWQANQLVPKLTVRYRYQLSIPRTQPDDEHKTTYKLKPDLHRALARGLASIEEESSDSGQERKPMCPIPPSATDSEEYYGYGAGYYAIEQVADFPVIIGSECFIARMNDWFGAYSAKDGLFAQLTLRKPGEEAQEREYKVNGRRRLTEISTSIGKPEGGAAQ